MNIFLLWKILIYGWVASEIAISFKSHTRGSSGKLMDRGSMLILWAAICLAIAAGETIRANRGADFGGGVIWLMPAVIVLLLAGIVLRWTAILTLGKAFSVNVAIRAGQTLYQSGLYRRVRHPSYTGALLSFLALGIETRNWIALLTIVVPITAAYLYRIHVEEIALHEAFGAEYDAYCRQTRRLIPGIY